MPAILLWEGPCAQFFLAFVIEMSCQGSLEPLPGPGLMAQRSLRDFPHRWAVLNGVGSRILLYSSPRFSIPENRPLNRPTIRRFEIARGRVTVRVSVEAETTIGDVPEREKPRFELGRAGCHTPFQNPKLSGTIEERPGMA